MTAISYIQDIYIKIIFECGLTDVVETIFSNACRQNIVEVKRVLKIIPPYFHSQLLNFNSFSNACRERTIEIMEFIWNLANQNIKNTLIENTFPICLINAIKLGERAIINKLLNWLNPNQQLSCLAYEEYNSFVYAADRGYLDILEIIYEILPHSVLLKAISASNFAAYRLAIKNKHTDVVLFLERISSPDQIKKMKKAVNQSIIPK